jgi:hypothetical protein
MPRKRGVAKEGTLIYLSHRGRKWLEALAASRAMSLSVYVEQLILNEGERLGLPEPPPKEVGSDG